MSMVIDIWKLLQTNVSTKPSPKNHLESLSSYTDPDTKERLARNLWWVWVYEMYYFGEALPAILKCL
jgi:hypothetical protein